MPFRQYSPNFAGGYVDLPYRSEAESLVLSASACKFYASPHNTEGKSLRPAIRVGNAQVIMSGGAKYSAGVNGLPSIRFERTPGTLWSTDYTIPNTYSMAVLINPVSVTGISSQLMGHEDNRDARSLLAILGDGRVYFDHGNVGGSALTGATVTTAQSHVIWCSYDASDKSAALGLDSSAPTQTGTFLVDHKAATRMSIGGSSLYTSDMHFAAGIICDVAIHKSANAALRANVLNLLADLGNVTLSA